MLNEYGEGYGFDYFELVQKSTGKQVYTSLAYTRDNSSDVFDYDKIISTLNYYFSRVNSTIEKQLQNPNISIEQKNQLKLLDKHDYIVNLAQCLPIGYFHKVYWSKEAADFLK